MERDLRTAAEKLSENDYEDVMILRDPDYDAALVGISVDNRAVYDYSKMIDCLRADGMTDDQAVEFIDYNTVRALAYAGPDGPIIFHPLE